MFGSIHNMSRTQKRLLSVIVDAFLLSIAYWGSFWVRLDRGIPLHDSKNWMLLGFLIPVSIFIFMRFGLYRAVLRYVSFKVLWTILLGMSLSTGFLILFAFFFDVFLPRTVSIIYFSFSIILIGGIRLLCRALLNVTRLTREPVIIYGAGSSGRQLKMALYQGDEFYPVAFVDDDPKTHGCVIQGTTTYSPNDLDWLIRNYDVKKILLAIPSASRTRRLEVINRLECYKCEVLSIPGMVDLVNGRAKIDQLNDVSIEELLGREPVEPISELMQANITGKNVLITGAGGSIGSELCRQVLQYKPECLVLFELSEYALYKIEHELSEIINAQGLSTRLVPLIGSVQRKNRVKAVMDSFQIHTVYHAAAYKHVPLVEFNVVEGVRNNLFGTMNCAQAAIESGVETFVLISTDKAVRPTNVMGASKRMSELVLQALAQEQTQTRFIMVRFGNVLGSSGSVVPLFRKQLQTGGPVTVTHPDIIRYFMTIPEAAQLVIQAGALGYSGDVLVLDMGKPVKILDLAHRMIRLSGLTVKDEQHPDGDITVNFIGLRPGEKLYEELLIGDNVKGTLHPRIMAASELMLPWNELRPLLLSMDKACHNFEHETIRSILLRAPLNFQPTDKIGDLVWQAKINMKGKANNYQSHCIDFLPSGQIVH